MSNSVIELGIIKEASKSITLDKWTSQLGSSRTLKSQRI